MNKRIPALLGLVVAAVLAMGASSDGCGGSSVKTAESLCQDTGGIWDKSSCPPACWPPKCGAPAIACAAVCGSQPICKCPKSAPFWEDGQGCMSASKCGLPPVMVSTDKTVYAPGSTIKARVTNYTPSSIFLSGCSPFAWQQLQGSSWINQGPDKLCVWEGIAREVAAGASYIETVSAPVNGSVRLQSGYSVGCAPGKPLSQGACSSSGQATSKSFTVQ